MNSEATILLIEDNQDDVDLTLRAFKKKGILNPITVKKNGAEALEYLHGTNADGHQNAHTLPIITLLDLNLPKIQGLEVLRQIRNHPRTRLLNVVMLTSSKLEEDIMNSYQLGANSYIRKPIDFNEFIKMVGDLIFYWLIVNQPPPI